MKIKWLGTAGFQLTFDKSVILIDPFISRLEGAIPNIPKSAYKFNKVDQIYLTHGHFDHAYDVADIMGETGARLYCSESLLANFIEKEIPEKQIVPLNGTEQLDFPDFSVEVIKSIHTKFGLKVILSKLFNPSTFKGIRGMLKIHREFPKGEVLGYFFRPKKDKFTIINFGSGGWIEEIISKYKDKVDLFMAPYAGRYDMEKKIAEFASLLNPKVLIPHHWDNSFPPLSWTLSMDDLKNEMKKALPQTKIYVPEINHEFEITAFEEFQASIGD